MSTVNCYLSYKNIVVEPFDSNTAKNNNPHSGTNWGDLHPQSAAKSRKVSTSVLERHLSDELLHTLEYCWKRCLKAPFTWPLPINPVCSSLTEERVICLSDAIASEFPLCKPFRNTQFFFLFLLQSILLFCQLHVRIPFCLSNSCTSYEQGPSVYFSAERAHTANHHVLHKKRSE